MKFVQPENEEQRITFLLNSRLLEAMHDDRLEGICRLAQHICGVPMALITLLGEQDQYVKASVGTDTKHTPRSEAFCSHTILNKNVLVVNDATKDVRFRELKFVTEGGVRFYAGAPLVFEEQFGLGALCVMDTDPRDLTRFQTDALTILAEQAVGLLMAKEGASMILAAAHDCLLEAKRQFDSVISKEPVMVFAVDERGVVLHIQGPVAERLGIDPVKALVSPR
jgi:hypothetical protein